MANHGGPCLGMAPIKIDLINCIAMRKILKDFRINFLIWNPECLGVTSVDCAQEIKTV